VRVIRSALVIVALAAAGCGGGSTGTGPAGEPTASAPEATAPPTDATQPGTTAVTPPPPTPTQTQTARAPGGNGGASDGEEPVRVPAAFVVAPDGRLTPVSITVPPFLAVELSLRARDGRAHTLSVHGQTLRVAGGGRVAVRIPGLRAGTYPVTLDGQRVGALVVGGEPGP